MSLRVDVDGHVMTVLFDRPEARNAMTFEMYDGLVEACRRAEEDPQVRCVVLRGAGDAFVAGTDIAQFAGFTDGRDGVAYEERVNAVVAQVERTEVVTIAAVRGPCVGGGLAIASACDLRIADETAVFGVPIARTLGNCLSRANVQRLVHLMGAGAVAELLLLARLLPARRMHELGFVQQVVAGGELDATVADLAGKVGGHAPLTLWASKQMLLAASGGPAAPEAEVIERVYGSADFAEGVRAFGEKRRPDWVGR